MKRKIKAVTILELVIAMALLGFLALTATAVLSVGDSIWRTEMGMVSLQEQTRLSIDGITREIRSASDSSVVITSPGVSPSTISFSIPDIADPIIYSLVDDEIIRQHPTGINKVLARNASELVFSSSGDVITVTISTTRTDKGRNLSFSLTEKVLMRNE